MPTHMPPVPPANRSKDDHGSEPVKKVSNDKLVKHEHHANAAEKGETANIKQNTTNKGFSAADGSVDPYAWPPLQGCSLFKIERPICKSHCK